MNLPFEIIYEIFYFLDIDTRLQNKIPPRKLKNNSILFIKPKLSYYEQYIIQEVGSMFIIIDLDTLETIIIIKYKEMYLYSKKYKHLSTVITNRNYALNEFL